MRFASVVLALLGLGVILVGLTAGSGRVSAQAEPHDDDVVEVFIGHLFYSPYHWIIPTGWTVVWENVDSANGGTAHSTKSFDAVWDSGTLVVGETFEYQFNHPGVYEYYDEFFPDILRGKIEVRDPIEVPILETSTPTEIPEPTDTPGPTDTPTPVPTATTAPATATATAPAAASSTAPAATATSAAPLPPNTGTGTAPGQTGRVFGIAAVLLVTSLGLAAGSLRRR
jgi:plastocyanin